MTRADRPPRLVPLSANYMPHWLSSGAFLCGASALLTAKLSLITFKVIGSAAVLALVGVRPKMLP